jgi:hypothetical protein
MIVADATLRPISSSLRQLLAESFTAEDLRHIAASFDARNHVPDVLAAVLADELAEVFSSAPKETEHGLIWNRPTIGWWRRRAERVAEARGR